MRAEKRVIMPTSYALGQEFERFVARLLKSGRYNSKSEVIREGLRLLEDRERERDIKLQELREAFRRGVESGPGLAADEVLDRLEDKYAKRARGAGG
jgi:antitoxin ParD1/3/4